MEEISVKQYCVEHDIAYLLEQLDIEENQKLDVNKVSYASHKRIWWQCSIGHKWQSAISDRLLKQAGCPYCANKKVLKGYNDLATLYEDVAREWHPTRNGKLMPDSGRK